MVDRELFKQKAPGIMRQLMTDFGLDETQAAGVLGNIGTECAGFHHLHEIGQPEGKGGYGWAQWTGPRHRSFFEWCKEHKLDWKTEEANYGYLKHDLEGPYSRTVSSLLKAHTLRAAVRSFERTYEAAGVTNYEDREHWAQIAFDAYSHRGR